jgi:hypothetical protein
MNALHKDSGNGSRLVGTQAAFYDSHISLFSR